MSRLELIIGPMFAGKSTELLRRIRRYKLCKKNMIIIGNQIDSRSGEFIKSHNGESQKLILVSKLSDIFLLDTYASSNIIVFDEAQFFPDLVESVKKMLNDDKHILCSGLSGTFKRTPFENISQIISLATDITFLTAICTYIDENNISCNCDASYTTKFKSYTKESSNVETGGSDLYTPRCYKHFIDYS